MSTHVFALEKIFTQAFLEEFENGPDDQTLKEKDELVKVAFCNRKLSSQQRGALNWVRILIKNRLTRNSSSADEEDMTTEDHECCRILEYLGRTGFFV